MKFQKSILFICGLFSIINSSAQVSRMYTTQDGLTTSALYYTYIDSQGLAWITGTSSVDMFDGNSFYSILRNREGLLINAVRSIKEYKDKQYWLITSNGLYKYNYNTNALRHIKLKDNEMESGISLNQMIDYPKKDYALISTDGNGIFAFNQQTQKVDIVLTNKIRETVPDTFCTSLFIDADKYLWVFTVQHKFFKINLKSMKSEKINMSSEARDILKYNSINSIVQLKKSHNILFTTNTGILIFNNKWKEIRALRNKENPSMPISTVIERKNGKLLVGTDSRGIWELDSNETLKPYTIADPNINLAFAKIRSFSEDVDGNLLVGIYQKGVLVIPNSSDNFIYHAISPTSNKTNATCITSIIAGKNGCYWIGTDGCGIFKSESKNLSFATQVNGLNSLLVQCFAIDNNGTVWTGSYGGGVQCYQSGRFATPEWLQSLSGDFVMSLAYDRYKNVLFVGTNGHGVFKVDLTTHTIMNLSSIMTFNGWTYSLHNDDRGNLWIGTAQGVYVYNIDSNSLNEVKFEKSNVLIAQCIASDGQTLLIGTNSRLVVYDTRTSQSYVLLPKESIMSIETTKSDVWVSTLKEIIRIDKVSRSPHIYTSFGGYFIGEFHRNSHCKSIYGEILFGADNGIVSFNPQQMKKQKKLKNALILTSLKVNGHDIIYDEDKNDNMLDNNIFAATQIHLNKDQNSLALTFSVPDYSSPNRIFYEYKLEGYDKEWHVCSAKPEVYYSSLPSGSYTFKIKAYYENNDDNALEKSIEITVAYPWFASWWSWLLYIIIAGLISHYLYKFYKERQKQKKLLVMIRQNEQLKDAKLRMFTSIAHELRSPLTMILSPLRQLMTVDEDSATGNGSAKSENCQSLYKMMKRNCDKLLNIVKQITDIRKIDSGQFHLHFSEVDFLQYSDDIFQSFADYATTKRIAFTIEHNNHHVLIWLDRIHFEKILSNLLSNAFKFTPEEGRVIVRTRCILKSAKDWFEIRVYNSGSYIDSNDIPHIFERFYQANNNSTNNMGSGIGLNLVTELVNLHHGTIEVHNVDPDGVEFVMEFPLGSSHLSEEELLPRKEEKNEFDNENELLFTEMEEAEEAEEDAGTEKKRRTLLVVDDDKSLCHYIKEQLQDTYNVIVAYGGNPAWQQILTQRPDAIVTDIRMPDGDGINLCKRIKANPETNNLPIIMLTSEHSDRTQIHSLNLDVDHFLSKPFNLLMLKSAIAQGIRVREKMLGRIRRTEVGYDYTFKTIDSADGKLFQRINESLKKNLDDSNFGVNELANEVGISRVHLNRKMKERYSVSPNNFIRSYRLKQAAYLLINNKVNVSEVAYRVGFSSHSHFSNTFRDYFGMTPKEFIAYYSENINDEILKKLLE